MQTPPLMSFRLFFIALAAAISTGSCPDVAYADCESDYRGDRLDCLDTFLQDLGDCAADATTALDRCGVKLRADRDKCDVKHDADELKCTVGAAADLVIAAATYNAAILGCTLHPNPPACFTIAAIVYAGTQVAIATALGECQLTVEIDQTTCREVAAIDWNTCIELAEMAKNICETAAGIKYTGCRAAVLATRNRCVDPPSGPPLGVLVGD